jgi:dipeptidyl aminopeptidase/acylaminoacyl peptidase
MKFMRSATPRLLPFVLTARLLFLLAAGLLAASAKAPFTFDAMMKLARLSEPQLSPDGRLVVFTSQTVDMSANSKPSQIWLVALDGGIPMQLTKDGASNTRPRWSPDGKRLFFVSNRSNGSQIWSMNSDGSDPRQVTNLPTGADGVTVAPSGKWILFSSDVYLECVAAAVGADYNADCNKKAADAEAANKVKARVYTSLLYRHWTAYQGRQRRHLLVQSLETGRLQDFTPGNVDVPPFSLGGPDGYAISPDSIEFTYVSNTDADLSTSTNSDLFTVAISGGEPKRITTNPGADEGPVYSPDGRYLAYRTQLRSGYESDQWRLAVLERDTAKLNVLTESSDRPVDSFTFTPDSKFIFYTTSDHGTHPIAMIPVAGGPIRVIAQGRSSLDDVQFTPDGKTMIYTEQSGSHPVEILKTTSGGGGGVPLTNLNRALLDQYDLTPLEVITVDGADGAKVDSFVVKPPGFDSHKRYPVLFLIHGGPEGEWGEEWTYRWNAQVFAGAGFLVVMPNPRGSTGYGQKFTDGVNGDWGGQAYNDVMATADYVAALPYADRDRMCAAGGSYGGYMIDWILGHTDRFRALVSHAGVYDLRSEAGATDELWFTKWEFKGFPWENPDMYERWSPSNFVKEFKTPTLVTLGELDYRVPMSQGEQLFTALQQQRVPSKLIQFPDEGHWILKPQNSALWYSSVIGWLNEFVKKP